MSRQLKYGSVSEVSLVCFLFLEDLQLFFDDKCRWMTDFELEHLHLQREQHAVFEGWHKVDMFGLPQQHFKAVYISVILEWWPCMSAYNSCWS